MLEIPNERARRRWVRMWRQLQAPTRPGNLLNRAIGAVSWLGEPQRYIDVRWRGREDFSFPGTRQLLSLPPRIPDIVHCHNLHGWYFDLAQLPCLTHTVPTVVDLRDEWLLTGHCACTVDCERWSTGCGGCPDLAAYPAVTRDGTAFNWNRKQTILRASRLYLSAPSRWLLERALRVIPGPRDARVIPNAVETTIFKPGSKEEARQRRSLPAATPIVLTTNHNEFKDLETTLRAIGHVSVDGGIGQRPQLIVLGRQQKDKTIGAWDIRFLGFVPDRTVIADYFRAADLFVHGARAEAFGKTIAEAMACGTAAVATRVGGIPEVLEDGETGFLVTPRAPQELAVLIGQLLKDKATRERVGARAVEVARAKYSLQRQADDVLDYYGVVIDDWHHEVSSTGA